MNLEGGEGIQQQQQKVDKNAKYLIVV